MKKLITLVILSLLVFNVLPVNADTQELRIKIGGGQGGTYDEFKSDVREDNAYVFKSVGQTYGTFECPFHVTNGNWSVSGTCSIDRYPNAAGRSGCMRQYGYGTNEDIISAIKSGKCKFIPGTERPYWNKK